MQTEERPGPVHDLAEDGAPIVRVPLLDGGYATFDDIDYAHLTSLGLPYQFPPNSPNPGEKFSYGAVVRFIARAGAGGTVIFRDGNTRNLRSNNLALKA